MERGVNLVRASATSRRVRSRGRANICRIDNFNLLPVAHSPIARTTRGSSSSSCPAKRMYKPPPPSTTTASGSSKSSCMMVCMWCRRSARAFPLMAVYGLSCGMLSTSAATAFPMVSVTNGKGVTAGTPAGTPWWNPFLRWNPLLEPFARTPSNAGWWCPRGSPPWCWVGRRDRCSPTHRGQHSPKCPRQPGQPAARAAGSPGSLGPVDQGGQQRHLG